MRLRRVSVYKITSTRPELVIIAPSKHWQLANILIFIQNGLTQYDGATTHRHCKRMRQRAFCHSYLPYVLLPRAGKARRKQWDKWSYTQRHGANASGPRCGYFPESQRRKFAAEAGCTSPRRDREYRIRRGKSRNNASKDEGLHSLP